MKTLLASLSLFVTLCSFSGEREYIPAYTIDSCKIDEKLSANETAFTFIFSYLSDESMNRELLYAVNGVNGKHNLNLHNKFEITLTPGQKVFEFYLSRNYYEIRTDSIYGKPQHRTYISIEWQNASTYYEVEKPVIYLYPEVPTLVEVKIEPKGELTFTYPEYNDGWKVLSEPNGDFTIDGNNYNYLFWESKQAASELPMDYQNGFIVEKEHTLQFLEEKLNEFGLNSEEKTDFITYWGPQLMKNSRNYCHFVVNSECDDFALLNITPKPDHVYRIYLLFTELRVGENLEVKEQVIKGIERSGFTVIEWGGSSIVRPTKSFHSEF